MVSITQDGRWRQVYNKMHGKCSIFKISRCLEWFSFFLWEILSSHIVDFKNIISRKFYIIFCLIPIIFRLLILHENIYLAINIKIKFLFFQSFKSDQFKDEFHIIEMENEIKALEPVYNSVSVVCYYYRPIVYFCQCYISIYK